MKYGRNIRRSGNISIIIIVIMVIFIFMLLIILYIVCQSFLFNVAETNIVIFRSAAIFVGTLIVLKLGMMLLNYIDDMPIIKKIKNKECDMLCFEGDLNDVTKSINYGTNSALQNYFIAISSPLPG